MSPFLEILGKLRELESPTHASMGFRVRLPLSSAVFPGSLRYQRQDNVRILTVHDSSVGVVGKVADQGDPIQMPMGNGYVLINPFNPCIQQYIPTR